MSKVFVVSDTWFNRIVNDDNQDNDTSRNNEHIISQWNTTVTPDDKVYVLGGFGISGLYDIICRLNGEIHFLSNFISVDESNSIEELKISIGKSNNDVLKKRIIFEDKQILMLPDNNAIISYYPLEVWPGNENGVYCFHGYDKYDNLKNHNISCVSSVWDGKPTDIMDVQENVASIISKL